MFGIRYYKGSPGQYIIQYKRGRARRQGKGLTFFYYAPNTAIVAVPSSTQEASFAFKEVSQDFQDVTVQGQVVFRVGDPAGLAEYMDFSIDPRKGMYLSEDPQRLPQRVLSVVHQLLRKEFAERDLRGLLVASEELNRSVFSSLRQDVSLKALGLEVMGFSVLALKPTPETARALEADVRESLLRQADKAAYDRRNAAVEQERAIKENELQTEIAVEQKKRQVMDEKLQAEREVQRKRAEMAKEDKSAQIGLEEQNQALVELATANKRKEADAKAYGIQAAMQAFNQADPRLVQALASVGMDPAQLIANAFAGLAENADRIGELNISPDLLRELTRKQAPQPRGK